MQTIQTTPSIWVGCLSAYNNGCLHGEWIDIPESVDELQESINKVLETSPEPNAEEWEIMDHEFLGTDPSHSLDDLVETAAFINEHGAIGLALLEEWDLERAQKLMDVMQGPYKSVGDYVYDLVQECYITDDLPDFIKFHIDYEGIERDWFHFGTMCSIDTPDGVYIYDSQAV